MRHIILRSGIAAAMAAAALQVAGTEVDLKAQSNVSTDPQQPSPILSRAEKRRLLREQRKLQKRRK